jgi:hypothetical protein
MENSASAADVPPDTPAKKGRRSKKDGNSEDGKKRRCISSACVPCRKRKSKVRNANLAMLPFSGEYSNYLRFTTTTITTPGDTCAYTYSVASCAYI